MKIYMPIAILGLLLQGCSSGPTSSTSTQIQAARVAVKGTAHLSWITPSQNTDGTPLTKCASQTTVGPCLRTYRVYHGTSPTRMNDVVLVNDRDAVTYSWPNLNKGTHYFSITALSGLGIESARSPLGSITIR